MPNDLALTTVKRRLRDDGWRMLRFQEEIRHDQMTRRTGMDTVGTDQRESGLFGLPRPVDGIHGRVEIDPSGLNLLRELVRGGTAEFEGVVDTEEIFLALAAGLVIGRGPHENQPDAVAVQTLREDFHVFDVAVEGGGAFRFRVWAG